MPFSRQKWLSLTMAALVVGSAGSAWALNQSQAPAAKPQAAQQQQQQQNQPAQPAQPQPAQQTSPAPSDPSAGAELLTEEKAVEQALKTNSNLQSFRLDVQAADINARVVKLKSNSINSDYLSELEASQQLAAAQAKYIQTATAEMKQRINQLALKSLEGQTKLSAQKAFYDWVNALAQLDLSKRSLERAQLQEKVAKAAFDAGTRAKTDVLQAQAGVAAAQAQLTAAQNAVETARLALNDVLGVDLNKKWIAPKDYKLLTPVPITLEEAVQKALTQRADVIQKQEEKKLAEKNFELISTYLAASTYQGQQSKLDIQKAELGLEEAKRTVTLQVTQAYNNLAAVKSQIDAYKKALDAANESYRLTKLRFDSGLATTLEVIQAEEELSNRENQYQQALHNFNLAVVSLDNALGN